MEIKKVKILKPDPESGGTQDNFYVEFNDGTSLEFPTNAVENRHYHEVKEWYGKKKLKPFKFKFE